MVKLLTGLMVIDTGYIDIFLTGTLTDCSSEHLISKGTNLTNIFMGLIFLVIFTRKIDVLLRASTLLGIIDGAKRRRALTSHTIRRQR